MLSARSVQTNPDGSPAVPFTPTTIVNILQEVLSSPYTGKDPKKIGLTKSAAAFMSLAECAQDGDAGALEALLNRYMGKPVQQINSLNVTATLSEFLGKLADEIERESVIDVVPEKPPWED